MVVNRTDKIRAIWRWPYQQSVVLDERFLNGGVYVCFKIVQNKHALARASFVLPARVVPPPHNFSITPGLVLKNNLHIRQGLIVF
jgi:hypothetical protein